MFRFMVLESVHGKYRLARAFKGSATNKTPGLLWISGKQSARIQGGQEPVGFAVAAAEQPTKPFLGCVRITRASQTGAAFVFGRIRGKRRRRDTTAKANSRELLSVTRGGEKEGKSSRYAFNFDLILAGIDRHLAYPSLTRRLLYLTPIEKAPSIFFVSAAFSGDFSTDSFNFFFYFGFDFR